MLSEFEHTSLKLLISNINSANLNCKFAYKYY